MKIIVVVLSLVSIPAVAQTALLPADPVVNVGGYNAGAPTDTVVPVAVADPTVPFASALRITRGSAGTNTYDAAATWATTAPVTKGDLLVATYYVRSLSQAATPLRLDIDFQQSSAPYNTAVFTSAPVDSGVWRTYIVPFRADQDYPAATTSFQIRYGIVPQSFDVGGISVVDYGQVTKIPPALAATFAFYYPGRGDPNTPWRTAALANIEATRKVNLTVRVVDATGTPVSGAKVLVRQTASAFNFGTATGALALVCSNLPGPKRPCQNLPEADRKQYTAAAVREFNSITFYNDLKWPDYEQDPTLARDGVAWVVRSGRRFSRAHNIIWPGFTPSYLVPPDVNASASPAYISGRVDGRIADIMGTFAGRIPEWDVVNEPYAEHDIQGRIAAPGLGPIAGKLPASAIADWFVRARAADPRAALFINEYHIFDSFDPVKAGFVTASIRYIDGLGGHVDGIGFQGHFGATAPIFSDMAGELATLDPLISRYALTEYDATTLDPMMQADMMRDMLTFVYGSPKFTGFQMWGFWDGDHWLGNAPIFNRDWTLKPSGAVWRELTQHTWRTNATVTGDASGAATIRAFQGRYRVSVTAASGKTCYANASVVADTSVQVSNVC